MNKPIFALLTDFGFDFAVASIKAVLLSQVSDAHIIDIDHSCAKFNIHSAGFIMERTYRYFPKGTIFICVVDPGVGTKREPLVIKTEDYVFVGPNNGLFEEVLNSEPEYSIYQIDEGQYLEGKSTTFHGRDLFAPVAADIAHENYATLIPFDLAKFVRKMTVDAYVAYIDSFGNIKTNKQVDNFTNYKLLKLHAHSHVYTVPIVRTFAETPLHHLLAYRGSNDTIEIAVHQGSAAEVLQVQVGDELSINF